MPSSKRASSHHYDRRSDPYINRNAYPDPYAGAPSNGYEYVGSDAFPDPPAHTFDQGQEPEPGHEPSRRRSRRQPNLSPARDVSPTRHQHRHHNKSSHRSATQPPRSTDSVNAPSKSHGRSTSYGRDESPRRHHHSRHGDTSAPRGPKHHDDLAGPGSARRPGRRDEFISRPAVQNIKQYGKQYGRKGLHTLGDVVEAYAASQAPPPDEPEPEPRPRRRGRRYESSPSPSPSPDRRGSRRHGHHNNRPPIYGRKKSYSVSPRRSRRYDDYDYPDPRDNHERGRHSHRGGHRSRRAPSEPLSPSPSPDRHRGRSRPGLQDPSPPRRSSTHHHSGDRDKNRNRFASLGAQLRSPSPETARRMQKAARAALQAGGTAAFQMRHDPGPWKGEKGARVASAAIGAAALNAFVSEEAPRGGRSGRGGSGMQGMAQSAIEGLLARKMAGNSSGSRKGRY